MKPLREMAVDVLTTADGRTKTALSRQYAAEWQAARKAGELPELGRVLLAERIERRAAAPGSLA